MRMTPPALAATLAATLAGAPAAADDVGHLQGAFKPLNVQRTGGQSVEGTITATRTGNTLHIEIAATGFHPGAHATRIHGFTTPTPRASECPEIVADINRDAYIDAPELRVHAGAPLFALDGDPAALQMTDTGDLHAGPRGRVSYSRKVDYARLEQALKAAFGTPPALRTRVVVIYGVPESLRLPETVRAWKGADAHASVPIACAPLRAIGTTGGAN